MDACDICGADHGATRGLQLQRTLRCVTWFGPIVFFTAVLGGIGLLWVLLD